MSEALAPSITDSKDNGMEGLQQEVLLMKSSRWPMLFYDEAACWIVATPCCQMTSVNGDTSKKAKQAKNEAWGLESVDSHIITYWTWMIGERDLQDTYWHIIEVLDDESDPQGKVAASLKHVNNALDDSEDDMAEICTQRATKQANRLKVKPTARKTSSLAPAKDKSGTQDQHELDADITLMDEDADGVVYNIEDNTLWQKKQKLTQHAPARVTQCGHIQSKPFSRLRAQPQPMKTSSAAT
ncbi:hypothetical protein HD554DRAFT_2037703 [Boletus coccyginus]|nr:hypothetical protein HD554DRAFT_2037703 [Boletus coccyginus]